MLHKVGSNIVFDLNKSSPTKDSVFVRGSDNGFKTLASKVKKLMPKPDDFLIAECIMMHAAEASLVDQATGEPILNRDGKPVIGSFSAFVDSKGHDSVKWSSRDDILPYKNGNGDIFPEEDLIQAHKEWVGKPLCKDHVSSTIDGVRGIILDTFYDPVFKRVHALFALDRKNYGELARKVEAGYATSVSMGTAVGRSICTECSNVAVVESDYCHHVRNRTCHGEVNKDLSPIELSIVVTGADSKAKILTVLAQIDKYQNQLTKIAEGGLTTDKKEVLHDIFSNLSTIEADLEDSMGQGDGEEDRLVEDIINVISILSKSNEDLAQDKALETINKILLRAGKSLNTLSQEGRVRVLQAAASRGLEMGDDLVVQTLEGFLSQEEEAEDLGASVQTGSRTNEILPVNDLVDSNGYGLGDSDLGFGNGSHTPGNVGTFASQKVNNFNKSEVDKSTSAKIASLKEQILSLEQELNEENVMTFADLKKQRQERKAFWQGTEEPTPGKPQYTPMGDADSIREKEDKQMTQDGDLGGPDGLVPGDAEVKKIHQRASLEERMARRAAWLKEAGIETFEEKGTGKTRAIDTSSGQVMADDGKTEDEDDKKSKKSDKEDKKDKKSKKDEDEDEDDKKSKKDEDEDEDEDDKKSKKCKKDEDEDDKKSKKSKKSKKDDKDKDVKTKKKAYFQGTEEPTKYAPMGDADSIREKEDKQMTQDGALGGPDGLVPGDAEVKKTMQRMAKLGGKLLTHASGDRSKSKWVFTDGKNEVLSVTASQAYGEFLNDPFTAKSTFADLFHSKDWGNSVRKLVQNVGLSKAAQKLGVKIAEDVPAQLPEEAGDAVDLDMPDMPELPELPKLPKMKGEKEDDFRNRVSPIIEQLEIALEDLKAEVEGPEEGVAGLDVSNDPSALQEVPEFNMDELGLPEDGKMASVSDKDMLEAYALLSDTANELCYIDTKYAERKSEKSFTSVAEQALHDAKLTLDDARSLIKTYASQAKRAQIVANAKKKAKLVSKAMGADYSLDLALDANEIDEVEEIAEDVAHDLDVVHHGTEEELEEEREEGLEEALEDMEFSAYDTMTASARKAWRASLVKEAKGYDDVYEGARSSGGHTLENLDVAVKDGLDKVETLSETHEAMLNVATKPLNKVKEAAAKLDKWVKTAGIDAQAVDRLVAVGAVDADAAKYWKEYYGEIGEKEFADGLLKDYDSTKKTASAKIDQVRIRRAYALGIEAQKKGIVSKGQAHLDQYVDTLVELPEEHFNTMKAHVAMYNAPKSLTSAPLVGLNQDDEVTHKTASIRNDQFGELMDIFA